MQGAAQQQQQQEHDSQANSTTTQLLDLDDASLTAVLSKLSARDLATAAAVHSTLRAAARANLLWLQLIAADFGVELVSSTTTAASASGADGAAEDAAGRATYQRLLHGGRNSALRALPCRAVATDGGCDEADGTTFWVSNSLGVGC